VRTIRLHTQQPLVSGGSVSLEEGPASHLSRVLRANVGDKVTLFNGGGIDWACTVTSIGKRETLMAIGEGTAVTNEAPLVTHLGLCMSKGERFDWAIQKATELGVSLITPLTSERVDVKWPTDRREKKQRHWQQIIISACEQCGRAVVPTIEALAPLTSWVAAAEADCKLVLDHRRASPLPDKAPSSVALLVGPEGGLTDAEIGCAVQSGFQALQLGPRVMRTETAPIAALAVIGSRWGDV